LNGGLKVDYVMASIKFNNRGVDYAIRRLLANDREWEGEEVHTCFA